MRHNRKYLLTIRRITSRLKMNLKLWPKSKIIKYLCGLTVLVFIIDLFGLHVHLIETDYGSNFAYDLNVNVLEILDLLKSGRAPPVAPINWYNYTYRIANKHKCMSEDGKHEDVFLLMLIKSSLDHSKQRAAIRNSWGFDKRFSDVQMRHLFLLGAHSEGVSQDQIDDENDKFGDIVQAEFVDSYFNNTIKTMMGFKWAVQNCPKTQFILLVDDDFYVSTKNLLRFLRNPLNVKLSAFKHFDGPMNNQNLQIRQKTNRLSGDGDKKRFFDGRLYAGFVFPSSHPMRHKPSKWYITLDEYPYSRFPPYVTAGAVALSFPAVLEMYRASSYTKHFRFDDIYIAILAKKLAIEPIHNEHFHYHKKSYSKEDYGEVIVSHGFEPVEMVQAWEEQKSLGYA